MGYSCSTIAGYALEALFAAIGDQTTSNCWHRNGNNYFYEIGREQPDGAITGTVYRDENGYAYRAGSFRISKDGIIERFPTTTAQERHDAAREAYCKMVNTYGRREADAHGRVEGHPAHDLATAMFIAV